MSKDIELDTLLSFDEILNYSNIIRNYSQNIIFFS